MSELGDWRSLEETRRARGEAGADLPAEPPSHKDVYSKIGPRAASVVLQAMVQGRLLDILNYPDQHQLCSPLCSQPTGPGASWSVLEKAHRWARERKR